MKADTKDMIQFIMSCIVLLFTLALIARSHEVDPKGEISESVLWVVGESFGFVAGVWGILAFTKTQIHKIDKHVRQKLGQDTEEPE